MRQGDFNRLVAQVILSVLAVYLAREYLRWRRRKEDGTTLFRWRLPLSGGGDAEVDAGAAGEKKRDRRPPKRFGREKKRYAAGDREAVTAAARQLLETLSDGSSGPPSEVDFLAGLDGEKDGNMDLDLGPNAPEARSQEEKEKVFVMHDIRQGKGQDAVVQALAALSTDELLGCNLWDIVSKKKTKLRITACLRSKGDSYEALGVVVHALRQHTLQVLFLGVSASSRQRGIGRSLVRALRDSARREPLCLSIVALLPVPPKAEGEESPDEEGEDGVRRARPPLSPGARKAAEAAAAAAEVSAGFWRATGFKKCTELKGLGQDQAAYKIEVRKMGKVQRKLVERSGQGSGSNHSLLMWDDLVAEAIRTSEMARAAKDLRPAKQVAQAMREASKAPEPAPKGPAQDPLAGLRLPPAPGRPKAAAAPASAASAAASSDVPAPAPLQLEVMEPDDDLSPCPSPSPDGVDMEDDEESDDPVGEVGAAGSEDEEEPPDESGGAEDGADDEDIWEGLSPPPGYGGCPGAAPKPAGRWGGARGGGGSSGDGGATGANGWRPGLGLAAGGAPAPAVSRVAPRPHPKAAVTLSPDELEEADGAGPSLMPPGLSPDFVQGATGRAADADEGPRRGERGAKGGRGGRGAGRGRAGAGAAEESPNSSGSPTSPPAERSADPAGAAQKEVAPAAAPVQPALPPSSSADLGAEPGAPPASSSASPSAEELRLLEKLLREEKELRPPSPESDAPLQFSQKAPAPRRPAPGAGAGWRPSLRGFGELNLKPVALH